MNERRLAKLGIVTVSTLLLVSACGSRGSDAGTTGGNSEGGTELVIGVVAPLSGDLSALGIGIKNSAELAVKKANDSKALGDVKLKLEAKDDEAKADVGRNAATALTANKGLVGVVGPLNSSVGQGIQPVFDAAGVALVSPANTNPALTRGADFEKAPKRMYKTYFRTCTTDAIQGPFAARYMFNAGMKKVATIHDKKAYGQGLVTAFTAEFKKLGGEVVAEETINADDKNFTSVITNVKPKGAAAVYYGGEYPQAGPLSNQMKAAGLAIPLMGGDGIYSPEYIKQAGKAAENDLATSVGAPVDTLESAKTFVADYKAAGYKDPYEAYGAYSYDAATALIESLKKVDKEKLKKPEEARKALLEAMSSVSFSGATGQVSFDEYGDNKARVLTVYKVSGGAWKPEKTEDFK